MLNITTTGIAEFRLKVEDFYFYKNSFANFGDASDVLHIAACPNSEMSFIKS